MTDEAFNKRVAEVEAQGKRRFGDDWQTAIDAVGRNVPGGIPVDGMRQLLTQPDPAAVLMNIGKEALLAESDNGSRESELQYAAIRQKEREAHNRLKGRR